MQTQATKGIVLKTVQYGDTSIIATIYTEVYGIQSYLIKGVRKPKKHASNAATLYQPSAILHLNVTHHPFKTLQYIQSAEWAYIYKESLFSVVKNAVSVYIIELLRSCIQEPEPNSDIFYLTEKLLTAVDTNGKKFVANAPVYFCTQLMMLMGIGFEGKWTAASAILDLNEGRFSAAANHDFILNRHESELISIAMRMKVEDIEQLELSTIERRNILTKLHAYLKIHLPESGQLRSWKLLQDVL